MFFLLQAAIVITVITISTIISVLSALRLFMWTEINGFYLVVQGILKFLYVYTRKMVSIVQNVLVFCGKYSAIITFVHTLQ